MSKASTPTVRDLTRTIHYSRFHRNRSGQSIADIAQTDRVSEKTITESIRQIEVYNHMTAAEQINHGLGSLLLTSLPLASAALNDALVATDFVEVGKDKQGKPRTVEVPDRSTRLRAIENLTEIAKVIQPKAPPASTHVQVGVGINSGIKATGTFVSMEARMRQIREGMVSAPQLEAADTKQSYMEPVPERQIDGVNR